LDDHQRDELNHVANIVIDAYLSRNESFVPVFADGTEEVMYLAHSDEENGPQGEQNEKKPKLNFWYKRSDYPDRSDDGPETATKASR